MHRLPRSIALLAVAGLVVGACSAQEPAPSPEATSPTVAPTTSATPERTQRPVPTAGPFPPSQLGDLRSETDVPFTEPLACGAGLCEVPLDVLAPAEAAAEPVPTILLLPGGPNAFPDRRYLALLAAELAERGAVVFLGSYRSTATSNTVEDSLHDVRCAVRFARSATADYGGDPDRLVLIGHSYASSLVLQTGVDEETDTPGCLADASGVPTAVVGLAGFGVEVADATGAAPPILLISGSEDAAAGRGEETAQELRDAGFQAEYTELEGIDHFEIVEPESAPEVGEMVLGAAGAP